jgi:uncharacterized membrane protein
MLAYLLALLLGLTGGLRTFAPLFGVRWPYHDWTTIVAGVLLLAELIGDKIPNVPARTSAGPLLGRAVVSGYAAWAFALPLGAYGVVAIMLGVIGALAGAFIGFQWRTRVAPRLRLPDLAAALAEDVVAVGGALWVVLANR